jgi:hypothetical protein
MAHGSGQGVRWTDFVTGYHHIVDSLEKRFFESLESISSRHPSQWRHEKHENSTIASGPIAALALPNRPRSHDIAFHRTPAARTLASAVQRFCRSYWRACHQSLSVPFPRKSAMKISWFEATTEGGDKG